ncbi:MAG: hypothetical protein IMZ61_13935 [Planctomycetes bacterium]|nr:hypothetical protein [Planctomycetota bacterium]
MSAKRRERTEELVRKVKEQIVNDVVVNDIEQYNFDKLVRQGIIVREEAA